MFHPLQASHKTIYSPSSNTAAKCALQYFHHATPCYGRPRKIKSPFDEVAEAKRKPRRPRKVVSVPSGASDPRYKDRLADLGNKIATELSISTLRHGTKVLGDKHRMNIVDDELCDHVIERLAPSLEKHKNCDVIDINPGVGLFSSKLHEVLKPRTHILMEPDDGLYLPYLQPLLDKEGSTYKLVPSSGVIWANLNKFEEDNLLPHQQLLPERDPLLNQKNDSLLLVANLGYYPARAYMGFTSITNLMIHQLLSAVRGNALFQGYGLVRMLIWMLDKEKKQVLPRVVSHRRKSTLEAELSCENIFEIAGSDLLVGADRREHNVDLESAKIVRKKMEKAQILTPPSRVGELEALAAETSSKKSSSSVIRPFDKELAELKERYARREFPACYDKEGEPVFLDLDDARRSKRPRGCALTPEYQRLCHLTYRVNQSSRKTNVVDRALAEYYEITQQLIDIEGQESEEVTSTRKALVEKFEKWKEDIEGLQPDLHMQIWQRLEERRMFRQDPPVLLWDRRYAEPLKVTPKEFYPQQEMCLLDFHPQPAWPILSASHGNLSNYDDFEFILGALFITPTQSVVSGLKSVAPGADEWILPRCPSMRDTTRGGTVDLNHLTVRSMSVEHFRELFEAWMDWPFKPSKAEMLMRHGSQNVSDEEEDDENKFAGMASV